MNEFSPTTKKIENTLEVIKELQRIRNYEFAIHLATNVQELIKVQNNGKRLNIRAKEYRSSN